MADAPARTGLPIICAGVAIARDATLLLAGVDLTIARGACTLVLGANGAGKSTLLKILSRITEPTAGRVTLRGRVASLLEVGTGFHPELSGRENIYLNGAILGMTRAEIKGKFDEIVAFAAEDNSIAVKKAAAAAIPQATITMRSHGSQAGDWSSRT